MRKGKNMWPFKCKHPAESLGVHKAETRKQTDEDFDVVTYHLSCHKCGKVIEIKYAAMRGGVSAFLERGKQEPSNVVANRRCAPRTANEATGG